MSGPLIDLADPAIWRMLKIAKKRGYITKEELDQMLPPDTITREQIEDVKRQLWRMHITVLVPGGKP